MSHLHSLLYENTKNTTLQFISFIDYPTRRQHTLHYSKIFPFPSLFVHSLARPYLAAFFHFLLFPFLFPLPCRLSLDLTLSSFLTRSFPALSWSPPCLLRNHTRSFSFCPRYTSLTRSFSFLVSSPTRSSLIYSAASASFFRSSSFSLFSFASLLCWKSHDGLT